MTKPTTFSEDDLSNVLARMIEVICGRDLFKAERMPIEQLMKESDGHIISLPINWSSDTLIITETHCVYLIPLLRRFKDVLSDVRKAKRMKAELSKE